jgi:glycosyl transferase family 87
MTIYLTSIGGSLAACFCFYLLRGKEFNLKNIIWIAYLVLLVVAAYLFIDKIIDRINHPAIWDFTAFYVYGKVAASGANFYLPENYHQIYPSLQLPPSFYQEISLEVLNVGFPYPPATMLYFAPLALLPYKTALICWSIFNLFFVAGCIYLCYDQFFRKDKWNGLILVACLFFLFPPVKTTVSYSQTNFILLFYLLLIRKYSDKKISGIFLALALFTKPYMAVFGLFLLLKKNWGAIAYSILSAVVLSGLALLVFGKAPYVSYISENPAHRLPPETFSEGINQSLHATLLRSGVISMEESSAYVYIAAVILLLTAVYLLFLIRKKLYDYILAVLLLVALLLYPGTLNFYGVVLLIIIFQFFSEKNELGFNQYRNFFIIGIVYALSTYFLFSCVCFLLAILMLKSLVRPPVTAPAIAEHG